MLLGTCCPHFLPFLSGNVFRGRRQLVCLEMLPYPSYCHFKGAIRSAMLMLVCGGKTFWSRGRSVSAHSKFEKIKETCKHWLLKCCISQGSDPCSKDQRRFFKILLYLFLARKRGLLSRNREKSVVNLLMKLAYNDSGCSWLSHPRHHFPRHVFGDHLLDAFHAHECYSWRPIVRQYRPAYQGANHIQNF